MKPINRKFLLLSIGLLVAAGGLWASCMAWRVHRQIVTLNVREVPLLHVLRNIERQTRTKIRAEKALDDTRITLRVTDQPLSYVLNRIAEQAGAHWSTLYSVYRSSGALGALESALRSDGKLDPAGWTKLAPNPPPEEPPPVVTNDEGPSPTGGKRVMRMLRGGPGGQVMYMSGPNGKVEVWSPQELIAESILATRLGTNETQSANARAAAEAARKVNGKWTTYLAFSKSTMGLAFTAPPRPGGPGKHPPGLGPSNQRFANLTPTQRVQLARQRSKMGPRRLGPEP